MLLKIENFKEFKIKLNEMWHSVWPSLKEQNKEPAVYISGPMSNMPNKNHEAFNTAAKEIRNLGYKVFNPAENDDGSTEKEWDFYMELDIVSVASSKILVLLPGWEKSKGANIEVALAERLNRKIYLIKEFLNAHREKREPQEIKPAVVIKAVPQENESIADEAMRLVYGSRQESYDHPADNFDRTAKMWEVIVQKSVDDVLDHIVNVLYEDTRFPEHCANYIKSLKVQITNHQVALMMVALKLVREVYQHKRDNQVDGIGYFITNERIYKREAGLE